MAFFDDIYDRVFGKEQTPDPVFVHKLLKRSGSFLEKYEAWKKGRKDELLELIDTSLQLKTKGIEQDPPTHVLKFSGSNAFAVSFSSDMGAEELQFLTEWFAAYVLQNLPYKKANGDVMIRERDNIVETIEKIYLKPIATEELPADQQFGNILIENFVVGTKPSYMKVTANYYMDRMYKPHRPFEELTNFLLKPVYE
ncbi:MAG: hypothetical protein R8G66_13185 [Cytophagales bacterium]|nr:hypothetical protein [Cytophagales bacterium]